MNTSTSERDENQDLRCAEYVLGVLDGEERAAVTRELDTNPDTAAAVAQWQLRLLPWTETIEEVTPVAQVWTRIAAATQATASERDRGSGAWSAISRWRAIAIGASTLAAALLVLVWMRPAPMFVGPPYLASTIQTADGSVLWTATLDRLHTRLIVVPATPAALPPARAPELWIIPAGAQPVALGMIAAGRPVTLVLGAEPLRQVRPTAKLAVSVEPLTGSPTGQPTGAVIAVGSVRELPAS